jgi:hypothetical protein
MLSFSECFAVPREATLPQLRNGGRIKGATPSFQPLVLAGVLDHPIASKVPAAGSQSPQQQAYKAKTSHSSWGIASRGIPKRMLSDPLYTWVWDSWGRV